MATHSTVTGQGEDFGSSKAGINNSSGNGSGPATKESIATSSALARRATGPRTKQGKERSKRNALKHGIFSECLLLKDESPSQFNSLLKALRNDRKPVGALEEILVEKLAIHLWCSRRVLIAERAEIQRGTKYSARDEFVRDDPVATIFLRNEGKEDKKPSLIMGIENPVILAKCVELLRLLIKLIETRGPDPYTDMRILKAVYGDLGKSFTGRDVVSNYHIYSSSNDLDPPTWVYRTKLGLSSEEEIEAYRAKSRQEALESTKADVVRMLQEELTELERRSKVLAQVTAPKDELEELCRNVPDGPTLDCLLRYAAHHERNFARTLNQLEHLQRMRLGQPVLPKLEVSHSMS